MRRRGHHGSWCGYVAIGAGVLIMMALILPAWFWWIVCAILLVCGGIWLLRC